MTSRSDLKPLEDRGPLRVMFLVTSLPVGGAETLLLNLVRRMDPDHFAPSICCLKELGPLGEELATETRVYSRLIHGKYDLGVVRRLARLLRRQRVDAVVTVGAGDKMFWGRIAARLAGVPRRPVARGGVRDSPRHELPDSSAATRLSAGTATLGVAQERRGRRVVGHRVGGVPVRPCR